MNILPMSDTLLNDLNNISPFSIDLIMSDMNPNNNSVNDLFMQQDNNINDLFIPQNNSSSCLKYILIAIIIFLIVKLCMKYKKNLDENYSMLNDTWHNTDTNACCGSGCGYVPNQDNTDLAGDSQPYTQEDLDRNKQFYNNELVPNSYTTYGGYQCIPNESPTKSVLCT